VLSEDGFEMPISDLVTRAINFPRVIIKSDNTLDPLEWTKELSNLIKRSFDKYNDIEYHIETNGMHVPAGMRNLPFVFFDVKVKLKNTGIPIDLRINDKSLQSFISVGSNIIFDVQNKNDIDEVRMLVTEYSIPKRLVFLHFPGEATTEGLNLVITNAKRNGFNFSLDYQETFWKDMEGDEANV
jgi:hypothetical protein